MTINDKMPNFFVVGAPKCATSSLYHYMGQHPDIFVPAKKEPHFFSWPKIGEAYYERPYVTTEADYNGLYTPRGDEAFAGDFSPSYLFHSQAAERIKAFNPQARIIMVLRNPVKRAISHYLMDRRLGYAKKPLKTMLDDPQAYAPFYQEYVGVGLYCEKVAGYFSLFGRDQVHVVIFEDFKKDAQTGTRQIFEFLGAEPNFTPDFSIVHNTYRMPRSRLVEKFRNSSLWIKTRGLVPAQWKNKAKPFLDDTQKPDFSAEQAQLSQLFASDIANLEKLIGRDLSHWRNNG